jgi:tetratricopeptide (TPR) repeat protein
VLGRRISFIYAHNHEDKSSLFTLGPFYSRYRDLIFLGIFFIYLLTLPPQIFWRDSAEFVATSYSLSISHPAGSPTYNLLAKIVTFLPIGSITFKVHLFSIICGVLTGFLLFKTLKLLLARYFPTERRRIFSLDLIAILSTSLFCFSFAFWRWSICAEVYSLQELFIVLMIYLSIIYYFNENGRDYRIVFLVAFLFSLSLGAHMTNGLYLPALGLFFVLVNKKICSLKWTSLMSFFILLGFSVYLYLPLRYSAGAALRLGSPSNLSRFWSHITASRVIHGQGGVLEQNISPNSISILPAQLWRYGENLAGELSLLGVLIGIVGFFLLLRRDSKVAGFTLLIFLGNLFFFRNWKASFGYMPTFLVYTVWIGIGSYGIFYLCINYLDIKKGSSLRKEWIGSIIILALFMQSTLNFIRNFKHNNLAGFYTLYTYTKTLSKSIDYHSVFITQYSIPQFPLWYFQIVENMRPDIRTIPIVEFPSDSIINKLLENEWDNYNFYWMGGSGGRSEPFYQRLVPNGLIFKFNHPKNGAEIREVIFRKHLNYRILWEEELKTDTYAYDEEAYKEIYRINQNLFSYYLLRNEPELAYKEFNQLLQINPNSSVLNLIYGYLLAEKKELTEAVSYFDKSLHLLQNTGRTSLFDKEKGLIMLAIGMVLFKDHHYKEAINAFDYYLKIEPLAFVGHYYLGLSLAAQNQLGRALQTFKTAQALRPSDQEIARYIKNIEKILLSRGDNS